MKTMKMMLVATVFMLPFAASAHDGECVSKLDAISHVEAVDYQIMSANFGSDRKNSEKDRYRLHLKSLAAIEKLELYKTDDTIDILGDIYDKVYALDNASKTKIDPADASVILHLVVDAAECTSDLP